jgi:SAM-dependent methyltransferase
MATPNESAREQAMPAGGAAAGELRLARCEAAYRDGSPPWDIGGPRAEVVRLARDGAIRGAVLDVGCGTGENALYLRTLGHEVWGIDGAPSAVARARAKAAEQGLAVTFVEGDALRLDRLGRTFDTVLDCGLFHGFDDAERVRLVESLAGVVRAGGTYYMLCFSELEPSAGPPRRVSQPEIRSAFAHGWRVDFIREARLESRNHPEGARAWLASVTRLASA